MKKSNWVQIFLTLSLISIVAILTISIIRDKKTLEYKKNNLSKSKINLNKVKLIERSIHKDSLLFINNEITNLQNENDKLYLNIVEVYGKETINFESARDFFSIFLDLGFEDISYGGRIHITEVEQETAPWRFIWTIHYTIRECIIEEINKKETIENNNFYTNILKTPVNRLLRDSTNLKIFFNAGKDLLFDKISKSNYNTNLCYFINALNKSYDKITSNSEFPKILTNINSEFKNTDLLEINNPDYNPKLQEAFKKIKSTYKVNESWSNDYNIWFNYWINTFWVRRFKENNMEVVHNILLDIQAHYSTYQVYDTDGNTFIYDEIGNEKIVLLEIETGEKVIVRDKMEEWSKINYDSIVGFIHNSKLNF